MIFVVLALGLLGYAIASDGFRRVLLWVLGVVVVGVAGVTAWVLIDDRVMAVNEAAQKTAWCADPPPAGFVVDQDESSSCAGVKR